MFQAAGPSIASIQATVDEFRTALGVVNNGKSRPARLRPPRNQLGRRRLDGDVFNASPFAGFQLTRGAFIRHPARPSCRRRSTGCSRGSPIPPTKHLSAVQPRATLHASGQQRHDVTFTVPGSGGGVPTTTSAFGAVFSESS